MWPVKHFYNAIIAKNNINFYYLLTKDNLKMDQNTNENPIPFIQLEYDTDRNIVFRLMPEAEQLLRGMTSKKVGE